MENNKFPYLRHIGRLDKKSNTFNWNGNIGEIEDALNIFDKCWNKKRKYHSFTCKYLFNLWKM